LSPRGKNKKLQLGNILTSSPQIENGKLASRKEQPKYSLNVGQQGLIEEILAAHFIADKKIPEKRMSLSFKSRRVAQYINENLEE